MRAEAETDLFTPAAELRVPQAWELVERGTRWGVSLSNRGVLRPSLSRLELRLRTTCRLTLLEAFAATDIVDLQQRNDFD